MRIFLLILFAALLPAGAFAATQDGNEKLPLVSIPTVGCPQSTMAEGMLPAKKDGVEKIHLYQKIARRVADYEGVLAPRGWHCFVASGSTGSLIFIAPQPIDGASASFNGPAIQVSDVSGETSGRFEVARFIARVFPKHMAFAQRVIDEGLEPASDFSIGPYPTDQLTYRGDEIVEYQTPPNTKGLGTMSRLWKNEDPIDGVAILSKYETSLHVLTIRLPSDMRDLNSFFIQKFESDAANELAKDTED
jgi:hypothetical protein